MHNLRARKICASQRGFVLPRPVLCNWSRPVLSTKKFHPSASTRKARLSIGAATVISTKDLLSCNVKT